MGIALAASSGPACAAGVDLNAYLGRSDLTLKGLDREYPSWLELTELNALRW
jgi:hypothetical protein